MPSPVFIVTLAVLCTLVAPIIGIPLSVGPFQGCAVRRVSARSSVLSIDFSLAVQPVEMGHLVGLVYSLDGSNWSDIPATFESIKDRGTPIQTEVWRVKHEISSVPRDVLVKNVIYAAYVARTSEPTKRVWNTNGGYNLTAPVTVINSDLGIQGTTFNTWRETRVDRFGRTLTELVVDIEFSVTPWELGKSASVFFKRWSNPELLEKSARFIKNSFTSCGEPYAESWHARLREEIPSDIPNPEITFYLQVRRGDGTIVKDDNNGALYIAK